MTDRVRVYSALNLKQICILTEIIGGILFLIGSTFFLPKLFIYQDIGAFLFAIGCLFYLILPLSDIVKTFKQVNLKNKIEFFANIIYLKGTVLFLIGSILFISQISKNIIGLFCFLMGSILFLLGSNISTKKSSIDKISIFITVGSILFLLGSLESICLEFFGYNNNLFYYIIALEYIVGSVFFLLGGIFNYLSYFRRRND